jgi:deazaflavin-dependent oxidoreductase (nitroreductase family)
VTTFVLPSSFEESLGKYLPAQTGIGGVLVIRRDTRKAPAMDHSTHTPDKGRSESRPPKKPPAWFVHLAWRIHRLLHRLSGGRFLWTTANKRGWGTLLLTTTGRTSGQERKVIIGYLEDGSNLVAIAMNGWDEGHPAWWLNLLANPDATVRLAHDEPERVRAREATGEERDRLWERWRDTDPELTAHARTRTTVTPVVVLER